MVILGGVGSGSELKSVCLFSFGVERKRERLGLIFQTGAFRSISSMTGITSSLQKLDYTHCIQG